MRERLALIGSRLYRTAVVLAGLLAVGLGGTWLVCELHDRAVVRADFRCLNAALAQPRPTPLPPVGAEVNPYDQVEHLLAAEEACHIESHEYGRQRSKRAWSVGERPRSYDKDDAALLAIAFGPVLALLGLRRWIRWLLSPAPPQTPSPSP